MAQFKGTFQIFPDDGRTLLKMSAHVRQGLRVMFYEACADAIFAFAEQLPVLTGQTRGAAASALADLEQQLKKYKISSDRAGKLDRGMTYAKQGRGSIPTPMAGDVDRLYSRKFDAPGVMSKVASRREWARAEKGGGASWEAGKKWGEVQIFRGVGNQYGSYYTFYFALNVPYWQEYDANGVLDPQNKSYGPYFMSAAMDRAIQDNLEPALRDYSTNIVTAISDWARGDEDLAIKGVLKYKQAHLFRDAGSMEADDSFDVGSFSDPSSGGDFDDEVPF